MILPTLYTVANASYGTAQYAALENHWHPDMTFLLRYRMSAITLTSDCIAVLHGCCVAYIIVKYSGETLSVFTQVPDTREREVFTRFQFSQLAILVWKWILCIRFHCNLVIIWLRCISLSAPFSLTPPMMTYGYLAVSCSKLATSSAGYYRIISRENFFFIVFGALHSLPVIWTFGSLVMPGSINTCPTSPSRSRQYLYLYS